MEAQGWRKATHALLTPISKTEETYQRSIMEQAVALGIWCLPFKWLEASWSAGRILPESIWAYEGGTPLLPRANLPDNQARQGPATTPSEIMPLNSTPTQDLDKLLRGAHLLSLVKGGDKGAVTRHLSLIVSLNIGGGLLLVSKDYRTDLVSNVQELVKPCSSFFAWGGRQEFPELSNSLPAIPSAGSTGDIARGHLNPFS